MKLTSLTLIAALAAPAVAAEEFTLHQYKHWDVVYVTDDDMEPYCRATVWHRDDVAFGVTSEGDGVIFHLFDPNSQWGDQWGTIGMQVDRRRNHQLDAHGFDKSVFAEPYAAQGRVLLRDIEHGRKLKIDTDNDRYSDYTISLHGSRAALLALVDCVERLN